MPELVEQMYCSQQIVIPPKFPYILKRYAKAAIKTQPYDLLRWSYEYFSALAEHRPPPVKLRLEYPVFSTEGGLTRGYLKVLACQLEGMSSIPLPRLQAVWEGSCLDVQELSRILCLCEARAAAVPRLHFLAVAAGMLTKSLTHTMILLCELLTHEPEGGSAAIDAEQFLMMYRFLAPIDASATVKYYNGYREGTSPPVESVQEEQEEEEPETTEVSKQLRELNASKLIDAEGMVSGRQMSTTSAEFVARQLEADLMETVYEQIDDLPDPALGRKKAKAEDVEMIRSIVEEFIDENLHVFVPEVEEVEEEVPPVPEVIVVYAVPGIGPPVPEDIVEAFTRYAEEAAREQEQMIMPRNLRHFLCPPLEVFEEHDYENEDKEPMEENIPFGGVLTD